MEVSKRQLRYPSSNNENTIIATVWEPLGGEVKGVFQIMHGMSEYAARYNEFAEFLVLNGYAVCANDHAGHGNSAASPDKRGYFAKESGYKVLVKDSYRLTKIMKKTYANEPYYIMGHSMGSFIARIYTVNYSPELSGAIFMGTGAANPLVSAALKLVNLEIKRKGECTTSPLIDKLAFGAFNKKFGSRTRFEWLSRDPGEVDKYVADEMCGFLFTASGYRDLFLLNRSANRYAWAAEIMNDIPMLVISGDKDPVGDYGKGVRKVYNEITKYCSDVTLKLYEGARHELLNETNKYEVYEYILNWLEAKQKGEN